MKITSVALFSVLTMALAKGQGRDGNLRRRQLQSPTESHVGTPGTRTYTHRARREIESEDSGCPVIESRDSTDMPLICTKDDANNCHYPNPDTAEIAGFDLDEDCSLDEDSCYYKQWSCDTLGERCDEICVFGSFCWKDSFGRGAGTIPDRCDGDRENLTLGLCYDKCEDGMERVGLGCNSICPDGYRDDGLFCRKPEYARDVGIIPDRCPPGKTKIDGFCYSACPSGTVRIGTECQSVCPTGFSDDGLFCRKSEYGRGAGYPWTIGDPAFQSSGMFQRCEADHGVGNCEEKGFIVYPKCQAGYSPFECCICRPDVPDCGALGLGGRFDLSCAKKVFSDPTPLICGTGLENTDGLCYTPCEEGYEAFGSNICRPAQPTCETDGLLPGVDLSCAKKVEPISYSVPAECPHGLENDAGICYQSCDNDNYYSLGPVCWSKAPTNWIDCGAGSAKDLDTCAVVTTSMVTSVFTLVAEIAFFGIGIAQSAKKAGTTLTEELSSQWEKFSADTVKILKDEANQSIVGSAITLADGSLFTFFEFESKWKDIKEPADILRITSKLAALATGLIPSGVPGAGIASAGLDVVAAYSYPVCSAYFDELTPM